MEYIGQSFLPKVQLEIVHEKAIRKTNSTSAIELGRKKIGIVDIKKKNGFVSMKHKVWANNCDELSWEGSLVAF